MTPKDFTPQVLIGWGGADVFNQGLHIAQRLEVTSAEWNPQRGEVTGKIARSDGDEMKTGFTLDASGYVHSTCPCRQNQEFGQICPHVIALAIILMDRMNDPAKEEAHQLEQRAAQRRAAINPADYIRRSGQGVPMRLDIQWNEQTMRDEFYAGGVNATLALVDRAGNRYAPEDPRLRLPVPGVALTTAANDLLEVIEDICEGPAKSSFTLQPIDFLNIVALKSHAQKVPCHLQAEFYEEDGRLALFPSAELPFRHLASGDRFLVHGHQGFVWSRPIREDGSEAPGVYTPLANVLPEAFQSLYAHDEIITREAMAAFLHSNLPILRQQCEVRLSPPEDFFKFVPDRPTFRLVVEGTRASLGAELFADYGGKLVRCGAPGSVCRPDPEDKLLYFTRNLPAEQAALKQLREFGFASDERGGTRVYITKPREVLNFFASGAPELERGGWKVKFSDLLNETIDGMGQILATVTVEDVSGREPGTVEVGCKFEDGGRNIAPSEIQAALNRGDAFLKHDGELLLLDAHAIKQMREVFADCPSGPGNKPGHFRVPPVYAPYIRSSLGVIGNSIELEEEKAPTWRDLAMKRNRDEGAKWEPVDLGRLEGTLRPYQKEGVYWMRFLEKSGLSGLLADEMGLGKTLQTLTWLSLARTDAAAQGKPALIVCPTSLVQNWAAEAEKFTPWQKKLVVSGPNRADVFSRIPEADLVITSYALLQRDLEEAYLGKTFSVVVLDEAQHIKNRQTRNAKAAKQLESVQKLVLTGTPVENSVADVWSIFDFLMPNYLGHYDAFKAATQDVIEAGGAEGRFEQEKLHRKLHPFILRRLKKTVAKDLPDKIIKVSYCPMTPEQQQWYNRLLAEARGKIGDMVKEKGFARARMEILALLMKLRQVASDLELLKEYRDKYGAKAKSDNLSGKLDVFFELLDEAIDGGHRVLVFSQFVTMLSILRRELEARGIRYCYLDGETKDRLGACRKFNTDESIPLFLISLHAGGTGLNLTGADMVIHFDPWWNPAVEDQATDRAHRIGQKRTVYVVKMIAEHSVEERVLALQQKKQLVIDATVGTTDAEAVQKLTYDDIKSIVGL